MLDILRKFSSREDWIDLIIVCISTMLFSILIKGFISGYFPSSRGIFQGDALSPFLFSIIAEAFGRSLIAETYLRRIYGIKSMITCDPISYQQFMDNNLIIIRSSLPEDKAIKGILRHYELIAG